MALVSVNDQDAIETRVTSPRTGAWHLDVLVDDPTPLAGAATVNINSGATVLKGTFVRSGAFADTGHVRIVAGAGGLGFSARPKHYTGTSVRIVLGDLLAAAGETISPTVDQSILAIGLDAWTTTATPIGTLISLLLETAAPGASWRMLPDGTLWAGRETWPDAGIDSTTYQIFEDGAETNSMRIGVDAPLWLVGTTFEGRQVSAVETTVGQAGAGIEARVWFEDGAPTDADRLRKAFDAIARGAVSRADRVDYGRMYPATIISQSGGTVDVQPDQIAGRALIPDMASVQLWLPAGMSLNKARAGRVKIGWHGGDPGRPFAIAFDAATLVDTVTISVLVALNLGGEDGALPAVVGTHQDAESAMVTELITAFGTLGGACTSAPLSALAPGFAAVVTALTAFQTAAAAANNFLSTKVNLVP